MTIYVGEALTIKASAIDPLRDVPITDALASCEFYAPGKDPKNRPEDREPDKPPVMLSYDPELQVYIGYVDTSGWEPGRWSYRVLLAGAYDTWEYGFVTLKA